MTPAAGPSRPDWSRNRLLRALPEQDRARILGHLSPLDMEHGSLLFAPDEPIRHVYFPVTGAVSILAETSQGEAIDTAIVGSEGFVGLPVFLGTERVPCRAVGQVPGLVLEMSSEAFAEALAPGGALDRLLRRYTQMRMVEMGQTILCNRFHAVEQRTARWLLQLDERVGPSPFELTQEFFATMLGTTRPAVTVAAAHLRDAGLIDYSRGVIAVVDRDGLEALACECFRIIRDELDRLLTEQPR